MAISHKNKLFFVHIPKNAGTSLIDNLGFEQHGHFKYDKNQVPEGYTTFCVVRHPLDRLVSCFEYARMDESYWHSSNGNSKDGKHPDYDLLKDATMKDCLQYLQDGRLQHLGWRPQWWWIANNNGVINLDHIIKMESLDKDLNKMFKSLSLPELPKTPKVNASKRKKYQDYFDKEDLEIAKTLYAADLKTFQYE